MFMGKQIKLIGFAGGKEREKKVLRKFEAKFTKNSIREETKFCCGTTQFVAFSRFWFFRRMHSLQMAQFGQCRDKTDLKLGTKAALRIICYFPYIHACMYVCMYLL
jgi:hypothetical protein